MSLVAVHPDTRMFAEAGEAPAAVARLLNQERDHFAAIGAKLRALAPRTVLTCGRGSSDHAATFAKYLVETRIEVPTASAALSTSSIYGARSHTERTLCLAISQSGRSPDLLSAVEAARHGGAFVLALVNDAQSPLAALADEVVPLCAGPERSVAATKSFITALAAIVGVVAAWAEDAPLLAALEALPGLLDEAWSAEWPALVEALRDETNLYVLGRGVGLGVAQEAALKLKETSGLHAEAFSTAEVRHGPMALVQPGFPALFFRQGDETGEGVDAVAGEMAARGAKVLIAGGRAAGATPLRAVAGDAVLEPILQIQSFYRAANALSLARGLDPDHPPHLQKVTETL